MHKTSLSGAMRLCGLNADSLAEILRIRTDNVKKMMTGKRPTPEFVWEELARIWQRIETQAGNLADVGIGLTSDPIETDAESVQAAGLSAIRTFQNCKNSDNFTFGKNLLH